MRRVVQFSTGNVGRHSLRAIIGRPDLELVGVHAANPEKIGRDAAELCGLSEPTGVTATDDLDALIALRPELCLVADSSLYVNGIDPGFSGDTAVHAALSLVTRAESITVQEIFDYGNYDDYEYTGTAMGFGTTPDDGTPMAFLPGVVASMFGGLIRNLAGHLDVELEEVRDRFEPWYATDRIECTMTTVEPGQLAGARFAAEGVIDGVPVITVEHTTRLTPAAAPDWEYPPDGLTGVHRVIVEGEPRIEMSTHLSHPVLDVTDAGCVSTAARAVNAIDWVCQAPAGLVALEDIPPTAMIRGLMW